MDALSVTNLNKTYPTFQLKNISLSLPKGYILGFVGENGAGKTTTINSILNITKRDGGIVKIFGKDIDQFETDIKKDIGYISGEVFYPKKQIKQVTNIYKRFYDTWDEAVYQDYLEKFKLDESKKLDELSKGMYLKYVLALALSHHASLLILDEPTTGLDPVARDNLLEIFQSLVETEEVSIFYSTHITSDLEKCADYIAFIKDGCIIEHSSKEDLLDRYRLVNGSKDSLQSIQNQLISYKENAFGFNGLIRTELMVEQDDIRYAEPTIDDILIFFSERREK